MRLDAGHALNIVARRKTFIQPDFKP
jgi:hypothetical protein